MRRALCLLALGLSLCVNATTQWNWSDLLPQSAQSFNDPFARFSAVQRDDLFVIMSAIENPDAVVIEDYQIALERFEDAGIDILPLIEQRTQIATEQAQAATQVRSDLVGQTGKIPGYIVPLEMDGEMMTQFLLVPTAGACVHTPPPPANQIVHVTPKTPVKIVSLYTPVWIEGELEELQQSTNVNFSDGVSDVVTSYAMSAAQVELYK
jgi:hypothetical protein